MNRAPSQTIPLRHLGPRDVQASADPGPCSHSSAPPWGLSCLLALQHLLVLLSVSCASHLLLLRSLPAGGLSYPPAQLLAASLFSCGVSTTLQTCMGSRLPLIQAPSFEFLMCALVLTGQPLPLAIGTPGNSSLQLRLCGEPGCPDGAPGDTILREVSGAVVVSGLLQVTLGLLGAPGYVFAYFRPLVLAPSLVVAGLCAHREVALFCSAHWGLASLLILLLVVCSQHLGSCRLHLPPWRPVATSPAHTPVFRLLSVLIPVACVWVLSASLSLGSRPLDLSAPTLAPWFRLPHPVEWDWPSLTPGALATGISMALAASASSLGCYALCGCQLHLPPPPAHACNRGLSLEGLGSVLAGLLGCPLGAASSFPNLGTRSLCQAGSRRVAYLTGVLSMGLGLSPRLTQLLTSIPLPVLGGVLGVTLAVVLSAGFSSFHLADIDSGRNIFNVGFSIFMALLLPRWFRESSAMPSTGWSPVDLFLRALLTEPVFLAVFLGFLLENTVSGTRLERGLDQGLLPSSAAQEVWRIRKAREQAASEYTLPFLTPNLCVCVPQPLRCLCPQPSDPGYDERAHSEPGEMVDLLPGLREQCPGPNREPKSQ